MTAAAATLDDLDRIVGLLARRRAPLVECAPIFWRPAPDAAARHRDFLRHLLTEGGAHAFCTDEAVLIAAPRGAGWLVDDMCVPGESWATDGGELWDALDRQCHGEEVRFVCPTYESERAAFATAVGLEVEESWWLRELTGSGGGEPGVEVALPGADAITVAAPPVYAPPGPMLFLPGPITSADALPVALLAARSHGCAGVVVSQRSGDAQLSKALQSHAFRRHCDFYQGVVAPVTGKQ